MKKLADLAFGFYAFAVVASLALAWFAYGQLEQTKANAGLGIAKSVMRLAIQAQDFYEREIIPKTAAEGFSFGHKFQSDNKQLPSAMAFFTQLAKQNTIDPDVVRINMFGDLFEREDWESDYDAFEREALTRINAGAGSYYAVDDTNGSLTIRYAEPLLVRQSCIDCHLENWIGTTEANWKPGDIGGVREVSIPFSNAAVNSMALFQYSVFGMAFTLFVGFVVVVPLIYRQDRQQAHLTNRADILEVEASTDPLTGLYNRRYFESALNEYLEEFRKLNLPLAVFILDLDHFKAINDTHGHDVGDVVLKEISKLLVSLARENDVVARIGGEEFAIIAPFASSEQVVPFANRYCNMIGNMSIPVGNVVLRPTVSIGVSVSTDSDGDARRLLKLADEQLYRAKNDGRNQVAA